MTNNRSYSKKTNNKSVRSEEEMKFALLVRKTFKESDDKRDFGLTEPEDIECVKDLVYTSSQSLHPDPAHLLDIYYPAGTCEPLPAIVSVHGGAFVYGDKNLYRFYCMHLAQLGFAVVNFSYRLAPEHKFPAQLNDINAAMQFACVNAAKYHIDPDNVFFVGDSAGAQMASQYCAAVTNPSYAELLKLKIPEFTLRAAALNCGMYELDPDRDSKLTMCYFDGPFSAYTAQMDVLGNITKDFPPCFIMTATGDFLKGNAEPLGEYLTQKGVENEVHIYGDADGKLGHVFHCDMRNPYAMKCNEDECAFFRRHISVS